MPGPVNPYYADVWAAFQPGADLAGYGTPSTAPVLSGTPLPPVAPAPNASGFPSLADVPAAPPPAPAPAGPPPPPPPAATPPAPPAAPAASGITNPAPFVGPMNPDAPPVPAGPTPPETPAVGPDPHAFDLQPVSGGVNPAHEVEMRGPSLLAAQGQRNAAVEGAIGTVAARDQAAAQDEIQMALSQERQARVRELAFQQSIAEQEDELAARQADFDTTARQLSRMGQLDQGRFWASRSTAQKLAGAAEIMVSGFLHGPSMVQKRINDDVEAQKFAYLAARDAAQVKQTAFSSAMAKYQNINAAMHMARAAGLDVLQAQLAQIAAANKGNEKGNRAIAAMAEVQNDRMNMIANGIKFVPAQSGGRYWVDPQTGLVYNETEAKALRAKQVEYGQQDRVKTADIGGQLLVQRDKAALEAGPDGSPLTKEQRGKMELERREKQIVVDAMNAQFNSMIGNPVLDRLSPISAARANAIGAPRHSPEAYADKQELTKLNQEFLTTLGKVVKDNEGKPGVAMLKEFKENFRISQGFDTKESAIKNIRSVQEIANNLYAQGGATPPSRDLSPEARKSLGGYSSK